MQPWIDFLPQEYRQRRRRLRQRWQQVALVSAALALAVLSVVWQQWRWQRLQRRLQVAQNHLRLCHRQALVLQEHRHRLDRLQAQAALYSFLRQPWSRSRVLGFLLQSLPEQVRLNQVDFSYHQQELVGETGRERPSRLPASPAATEKRARQSPAAQDLEQLQLEQQQRHLLLLVHGTADDYDQVHRLLARLKAVSALQRLQLLEVASGPRGRLVFRLQGQFRPAFPEVKPKPPTSATGNLQESSRR